jgi:tRNA ligase
VDKPKLFSGYQHSHGIIASRQEFLTWMASPEGQSRLAKEKGERSRSLSPVQRSVASSKTKTIIVPVAIPGCGKTSVAIALAHLFGFGHTQSDDVITKGKKTKAAPIFESNVRDLLQGNGFDVVIADK